MVLAAVASPGQATASIVAAYMLGTFPTALLVGRSQGVDPTVAGSRNPGATTVARTAGHRAGILTFAGDAAKGAGAAGLGWAVGGHGLGVACGLAAVAGHVLPVTRGLRGGKGVATAAGMAVVLFPAAAAVAGAAFGVTVAATRTVSAGSIAGVVTLPVAAAAFGAPGAEVAALVVGTVLIVARHRDNIARLRRGEEHGLRPRPGG
jgi:acyl phosphate:glycerol-3-phosphate acyltransferase